jgi:two-component system response regulator YesN
MLVDDEQILRDGMRKYIPWEKHGFQVKFEASSGLEALRVMNEHKVDLLFLDIRMPGMTGLELLSNMSGRREELHIVILSGFSEFEYAREAMRYRVTDYLLKPVRPAEVEEVLVKIREEKEKAGKRANGDDRDVLTLIQTAWFRLTNRIGVEHAADSLYELLARRCGQASYTIAVIPADTASDCPSADALADRFSGIPGVEAVFAAEQPQIGYVLLIALNDHDPAPSRFRSLDRNLWTDKSLNILVSIPGVDAVVYSPVMKADHLLRCLREPFLIERLRHHLFYSTEPVAFADFSAGYRVKPYAIPDSLPNELAECIKANDRFRAKQKLSDLYFHLITAPFYDPQSVATAYEVLKQRTIQHLCRFHDENGNETQVGSAMDHHFSRLKTLHGRACRWLDEVFLRMEDRLNRHHRRLIREMIQYIQDHLSEPVLLSDLADHFHISAEYLSQLFKKEVGINFNQYLRQQRISKAKQILDQDGRVKIYELAQLVGYSDPKHFSKVFRETLGLTPKEYAEHSAR